MHDETAPDKTTRSSALERLRDRTDELELIISSLTIFALFSIPGWLFNSLADVYTHVSLGLAIASNVTTVLLTGFCYGLGACFVVHLMARAYWVGLIGLRSAFPDGINWRRTPTLGPITREHYRNSLPDLDSMIQTTDRLASSLFAVISMLTLSMLWFGTILVVTLEVAGMVGARVGLTNTVLSITMLVLVFVLFGLPVLTWLLDAVLAARVSRLRASHAFRGFIRALRLIAGIAYPKRLVLPVQLTLQSNTRPFAFFATLVLAVVVITFVGNYRVVGWREFTLSRDFTYLPDAVVRGGFRSAYYEDMASSKDRFRAWPRISSFMQAGSFVRLFLPYQPLRDNLVLDQLCAEAEANPEPVDCLRRLWSVSLSGRDLPLDPFVVAERGDLRMRGLLGLVPTAGLEPGMHELTVVWNPNPKDASAPVDDRYQEVSNVYTIPFAFAPDYELSLETRAQ